MKRARGEGFVGNLAHIKYDEGVRLDASALIELHVQLGEQGAEEVICRAMEELSFRLARLAPLYRDGRWVDLAKCARSLIGIAEQIGMTRLAKVAGDVAQCAARRDGPALAATLERLDRIGDRSLAAIWDSEHQSV